MKELIIHNLKAGWLNVMKYKTQNTISVLCLSVGAIFFAIALYFANMVWENEIKNYFHNDPVKFIFVGNYQDDEVIETVSHLPAVKSVCYSQETNYSITFGRGWFDMGTQARYITPDFLEKNHFRSKITGKKIGKLKPGTIVATRDWYKVHIGKDPIGEKIMYSKNRVNSISDVVNSTTFVGYLPSVYIVAPQSLDDRIWTSDSAYCISASDINSVELSDGYTEKQFKAAVEKAMPGVKILLASDVDWQFLIAFIMMILLGSMVLVIGMSGYLKMQLQLFCLRSREMALRHCNGAKPVQLFMLLCSELFIVFLFTAVVAMIISVALAAYAMPKLDRFGFTSNLCVDAPTIYCIVVWVILAAFLVAVGIAWITVRKMLRNPLSTAISNPFSQRTKMNKSMQVVQYVATTIMLAVIGCIIFGMAYVTDFFSVAGNINDYKKIGFVYGMHKMPATKLPSVEKYGWWFESDFNITKADSARMNLTAVGKPWESEDGTLNYAASVFNVETAKMLKFKIQEKAQEKFAPVYAKVDDVASVVKQLDLKYKPAGKVYTLPNGKKYRLLGWTSIVCPSTGAENYFVIENKMYEYGSDSVYSSNVYPGVLLFKLKNDDINSFLKQASKYGAMSLYDSNWCAQLKIFIFISTLLLILAIVSVLSIVLTIYSSVSLETRGKQKEVAIRKVNGAKTRDIVMLFSRYYIVTLAITFCIVTLLSLVFALIFPAVGCSLSENIICAFIICFISIAVITVVTILTLWQKIYRISHINPANLDKEGIGSLTPSPSPLGEGSFYKMVK